MAARHSVPRAPAALTQLPSQDNLSGGPEVHRGALQQVHFGDAGPDFRGEKQLHQVKGGKEFRGFHPCRGGLRIAKIFR